MSDQHSDPSSLWTRCRHHEQNPSTKGSSRLWHSSVLEPGSLRVWVIGGIINDLMQQPDHEVSARGTHLCHPDMMLAPIGEGGQLCEQRGEGVTNNC